MAKTIFSNSAQSTSTSALTAAATTVTLVSTAAFPVPGTGEQFYVRIDDTGTPGSTKSEIAICTNNNTGSNQLTLTRGADGTTAAAFAPNLTVTCVLSNAFLTQMDQQIASTTLGGAAASVTFSSIPASMHTLLLRYAARDSSAGTGQSNFTLQFNGDTGTNYDAAAGIANNAAASAEDQTGATSGACGGTVNGGALANAAGVGQIMIPSYVGGWLKSWVYQIFTDTANTAAGLFARFGGGTWNSTAVINQIVLLCGSGSFAANSYFTLLGEP